MGIARAANRLLKGDPTTQPKGTYFLSPYLLNAGPEPISVAGNARAVYEAMQERMGVGQPSALPPDDSARAIADALLARLGVGGTGQGGEGEASGGGNIAAGIAYTTFMAAFINQGQGTLDDLARPATISVPRGAFGSEALGSVNRGIATAAEYDPSRIMAEIDALAMRERTNTVAPTPESGLPMQTLYFKDGTKLEGRGVSLEDMIVRKMDEAAKSPDPAKRTLDLSGAIVPAGTHFKGLQFNNVKWDGADLNDVTFTDCGFKNNSMREINARGMVMDKCHLDTVDMTGFQGDAKTAMRNTRLDTVSMTGAVAPGMTFENINANYWAAHGADFSGGNWNNVHAHDFMATGVKLNGCKIGHLHITGQHSTMEGAEMMQATVGNSSFGTYAQGMDLRGLKAAGSTWTDVGFGKSDLSGADFSYATFTRTDMSRVVTPEGPMQMMHANITGLTAGPDAKMQAYGARIGDVVMQPVENFVFSGTAPLQRAYAAAVAADSKVAHITNDDGMSLEAANAKLVVQPKPRPAAAMRPMGGGMGGF